MAVNPSPRFCPAVPLNWKYTDCPVLLVVNAVGVPSRVTPLPLLSVTVMLAVAALAGSTNTAYVPVVGRFGRFTTAPPLLSDDELKVLPTGFSTLMTTAFAGVTLAPPTSTANDCP